MRNTIGSIRVMNGEIEEDAIMKLSPTRIIRAITVELWKWKITKTVYIVTERKFGKLLTVYKLRCNCIPCCRHLFTCDVKIISHY